MAGTLVKILSSELDGLSRRIVKFLGLGRGDVQTSYEANPYGVDANPIKDMVAVYMPTSDKGKTVIVGYINKSQIAEPGEYRTFSTDTNGVVQFYIHQKNNGTCEIGGSVDNLVRYTPLNTALSSQNTAINAEFAKIATAINSLAPGAYVVAPVSVNISGAKIDEIKTL
jgi:hypothetical protein